MTVVTYYPGYDQLQVHENLIVRTILEVTQDFPMVVTTTEDHHYVIGMMVTFLIPSSFGMVQLNGLNAQVIDTPTSDILTINVDSRSFTTFAYPSPLPNAYTPSSIIPNSSGPYVLPLPLPYGNQNSFEGAIFNNGIS